MTHGALPLNLSLEWPSVWGGKSLKFLRKMTILGTLGVGAPRDFGENELKLSLSRGRKIIETP